MVSSLSASKAPCGLGWDRLGVDKSFDLSRQGRDVMAAGVSQGRLWLGFELRMAAEYDEMNCPTA